MMPKIVLPFLLLIFLSACVQYHYSPNVLHTPYIEKQGDAVFSAGVGGGPTTLNTDLHASYSPVPHWTLMLNYFRNKTSFEDANFFGGPTYQETAKGYFGEGAVGAYTPLAFGSGAIYGGWGFGEMRNDYGIGRFADLWFRRFFIQPTYTFKNDWFRIGMGVRIIRLSFPKGNIDYRIDPDDIQSIQNLEYNSPFWFPEFGGNIGIHLKPITIVGNAIFNPSQRAVDNGIDNFNIGIGLSVELEDLGRKKSKKKLEEDTTR